MSIFKFTESEFWIKHVKPRIPATLTDMLFASMLLMIVVFFCGLAYRVMWKNETFVVAGARFGFDDARTSASPVGSIICSTLPPTEFLKSPMDLYWHEADGKATPLESSLAAKMPTLPKLQGFTISKMAVSQGVCNSGENLSSRIPQETKDLNLKWTWGVSLNDIMGNPINGQSLTQHWNEHTIDNFRVQLSNDVVIAEGRTWNNKEGEGKRRDWGNWSPGKANYFGVGLVEIPVFYYIRIQ